MKQRHAISLFLLSCILVGFFTAVSLPQTTGQESANGSITFQPNVIPSLIVTARPLDKPESFRFEWYGNKFDVELFFNATLQRTKQGVTTNITKIWSLRDFEVDFALTVNYVVNKNETHASFGWEINNLEQINEWIHEAWMKIEDTFPFDYDVIEVEEIDTFLELGYNMTRFKLPDNLWLDFEDLRHKGFVIGNLNKTTTHIRGFERKSHWNLDPITYSAPTITITGDYSTKRLHWELWNASSTEGWNVVWNHLTNNTQYQFDCLIQIGDGSTTTTVVDYDVEVTFSDYFRTANYQACYTVKNKATMTLGVLVTAASKSTRSGVSIIDLEDDYYTQQFTSDTTTATANLYGLTLNTIDTTSAIGRSIFYNGNAYNCMFTGRGASATASTLGEVRFVNMDIYNIYGVRNYEGLGIRGTSTCDTIKIFDSYRALYPAGASQTISNVYARDNTYLVSVDWRFDHYLINIDTDSWTFVLAIAGSKTIYRQYTMDFTIIDNEGNAIESVTITIEDTYGAEIFSETTDENGQITTQTVSRGYYTSAIGNTLQDYSPHTLTITKSGYLTYTTTFTLTEKIDWAIMLTSEDDAGGAMEVYLLLGALLAFGVFFPFLLLGRRKWSEANAQNH